MLFLVLFLLLLSILPFFIPLPVVEKLVQRPPFENSEFIKLENTNVHYRVWKPDSNSSSNYIFLFHGFSGSTFSYEKLATLLAKENYCVVAMDFPGFGFSDKSEQANFSDSFRIKVSQKIMNQINSSVQWTVVGHSMGAKTAVLVADFFPEKINRIILLDGVPGLDKNESMNFFSNFILSFQPVKKWAEILGNYFLFKENKFTELLTSAYGRPPSPEEVSGYLKPFFVPRSATSILEMSQIKNKIKSWKKNWKQKPLMLIWGEKDKWIAMNIGKEFHDQNKGSVWVEIKNAGHCPMETHPVETASSILNFIKDAK